MSGFSEQDAGQYIVTNNPNLDPSQLSGRVSLFSEDGNSIDLLPTARKTVLPISSGLAVGDFISRVGPYPSMIGVLQGRPGRTYTVLSAFAKLLFKTTPYVTSDLGVTLYLSYFADGPDSRPEFESDLPPSFWGATDNTAMIFSPVPGQPPNAMGQTLSLYGDSFGTPLTEGDSDLEVVVYYTADDTEGASA